MLAARAGGGGGGDVSTHPCWANPFAGAPGAGSDTHIVAPLARQGCRRGPGRSGVLMRTLEYMAIFFSAGAGAIVKRWARLLSATL